MRWRRSRLRLDAGLGVEGQDWRQGGGGGLALDGDTPSALGVDISYNTMKRLIVSGFICGSLIAPDTCLVDLASLFEHINATRDFEF